MKKARRAKVARSRGFSTLPSQATSEARRHHLGHLGPASALERPPDPVNLYPKTLTPPYNPAGNVGGKDAIAQVVATPRSRLQPLWLSGETFCFEILYPNWNPPLKSAGNVGGKDAIAQVVATWALPPAPTTSRLLEGAREGGYAVGAFNVYNLEGVAAVVAAAEALQSPAILQVRDGRKCCFRAESPFLTWGVSGKPSQVRQWFLPRWVRRLGRKGGGLR